MFPGSVISSGGRGVEDVVGSGMSRASEWFKEPIIIEESLFMSPV